MSYSRLYRSTTSKVFGGVAGGIAEYFNMDPVIIRVIFVLAAIFGGGGVLIYLVLWIAVPERPYTLTMFNTGNPPDPGPGSENPPPATPENSAEMTTRKYTGSMIGGIILIGVGALILATRVIPNLFFSDLWPFVLVVAGIILIVTSMNQTTSKER
jgi:phage shock protein PspC (stress-responsive transcriptional regulator)